MVIISLGGSLIVPDEVNWDFLVSFKSVIESYVSAGQRFAIVTGGGKTARRYQTGASKLTSLTDDDRDWLGIHATRLNAHLIRTLFRDNAHKKIWTRPEDFQELKTAANPILVAAGWKPGNSTDLVSVMLASELGADVVVNLSNIDYVCDEDPRINPDSKRYETMNWTEFRRLVGDVWSPGLNAPFDPVAARLAQEKNLSVVILNGRNIDNVKKFLDGKQYVGTLISDEGERG